MRDTDDREVLAVGFRHSYEEYLQLPKFRRARPETVRKVGVFLEYVWLSFKQKKEEEAKEQARRTMISQSMSFAPADPSKDSRLGCYNYFPAYEPYQKFNLGMPNMPGMGGMAINPLNQPKMAYSPYPYYYNFPNYQYPQNYGPQGAVLKYNDYFRGGEKGNQPAQ